ncbi:hypothetical protein HME9302_02456 [Alteripontixanthobacter maritimus]|uniref:Uncharacterized protein n=1 Tax=Alteripontixanthobacter maritimus TaxID=2161824 RepID=A0A369QDD2_9SPHN|nr:hypothetical protein [Alteripontixanthobacter maritimus]RDC61236.1 hypothetical protein HME9302_02456 [Alteripontixanthobacter maritimus]
MTSFLKSEVTRLVAAGFTIGTAFSIIQMDSAARSEIAPAILGAVLGLAGL